MTKNKLSQDESNKIIIANIYKLMEHKNWTIKTLSCQSEIPYETLKKLLSGKIKNISLFTIIKIATALDCTLDYLLNSFPQDFCTMRNLPTHLRSHVQYMSNFYSMQKPDKSLPNCLIPLYTLCRNHSAALYSEYSRFDLLNITNCNPSISFAIRITNNFYHPIYYQNDVLLCGCDRPPHYGEVGIFLHKNNIYIRQFLPDKNFVLAPVNGIGYPITLTTLDYWFIYGYVIGVH